MLDVGDRLADRDVLDAGEAHDIAGGSLLDVDSFQSVERVQLRDLRLLDCRVELADGDGVADLHAPVEDPADGDAADVVARIEIRDQ